MEQLKLHIMYSLSIRINMLEFEARKVLQIYVTEQECVHLRKGSMVQGVLWIVLLVNLPLNTLTQYIPN